MKNAAPNPANLPATGYVRKNQIVPHIIPIGATTLWRWVREGRFPKPVRITNRVTAWRAEDVRAWIGGNQ